MNAMQLRPNHGLAAATLLISLAAGPSFAQSPRSELRGFAVGGSIGLTRLEGVAGSVPSAGSPVLWSVRVSVPVDSRLSVDAELSRSRIVEGRRLRRGDQEFRERRRDVVWAFYARLHLWRHGLLAIHPVAGFGVVKPSVDNAGRSYNPLTRQWSEWRSTASGYTHTWAFSWGTDLLIGSRHFAVVPEFRAHHHAGNVAPWVGGQPRRSIRGGVGVRYQF